MRQRRILGKKDAVDILWQTEAFFQKTPIKGNQRIDEITAAETVEMMIQFHIGRCHPLRQNRKGQYAVDLVHPYRLVFEKHGNTIQIAHILEITDYH